MNYLNIIKHNWQTIIITVLSVIILSLVLSLLQPLKYGSRVEMLIIQKQTLAMDAYTSARASEKLASTLASVIKTKSFFDKIIAGDFGIQRNDFPAQEKKLRKAWQKQIKTTVLPESSLLRIDIYDKNKKQANKIAGAVAHILVNNSQEYHGGGQDVIIKVVNEPLVSNYPVKPNIILNTLTGLIIGLILSISWAFYRASQKIKSTLQEKEDFDLAINQPATEKIKTMYDYLGLNN